MAAVDVKGPLQFALWDHAAQILSQIVIEKHRHAALCSGALLQPQAVAVAVVVLGIGILKAADIEERFSAGLLPPGLDGLQVLPNHLPIVGESFPFCCGNGFIHKDMPAVERETEILVRMQSAVSQKLQRAGGCSSVQLQQNGDTHRLLRVAQLPRTAPELFRVRVFHLGQQIDKPFLFARAGSLLLLLALIFQHGLKCHFDHQSNRAHFFRIPCDADHAFPLPAGGDDHIDPRQHIGIGHASGVDQLLRAND